MGPLIFVMFINDLLQSINFMIPFIFATDTKCFQSINYPKNVTNSISSWNYTTNLLFNESKFILLTKPTTNISIYTVNNKSINTLTQHKDLGIPLPMIFIGVNIIKLLQPKLTRSYSIVSLKYLSALISVCTHVLCI